MKTPVEKLIEAVENGYHENKTLWNEWKETILKEEALLLKYNKTNDIKLCNCEHSDFLRSIIAGMKCGVCNGVIE